MESDDKDEILSWRAATIIMVAATIFTLTARVLGTDPFTWIFDLLIVYLPTLVLLGAVITVWLRRSVRRTGQATA